MALALAAGKPVRVSRPTETVADGMTPPFVGTLAVEAARTMVDEIATVSEEAIVEAMELLITRAKLLVEGSGAAAVAALLSGAVKVPDGSRVVAIVSGGNIDLDRVCSALSARH